MAELKPLPAMEGACGTLNQLCSPFEALCFPCAKMMDAERCGMSLRMRVMVMGALMGLYQCADTAYDASQPLAGDQYTLLWIDDACLIAAYFAGAWSVYNHNGKGSRSVLRFAWFAYGLTWATYFYQFLDVRAGPRPPVRPAAPADCAARLCAGAQVVRGAPGLREPEHQGAVPGDGAGQLPPQLLLQRPARRLRPARRRVRPRRHVLGAWQSRAAAVPRRAPRRLERLCEPRRGRLHGG